MNDFTSINKQKLILYFCQSQLSDKLTCTFTACCNAGCSINYSISVRRFSASVVSKQM